MVSNQVGRGHADAVVAQRVHGGAEGLAVDQHFDQVAFAGVGHAAGDAGLGLHGVRRAQSVIAANGVDADGGCGRCGVQGEAQAAGCADVACRVGLAHVHRVGVF